MNLLISVENTGSNPPAGVPVKAGTQERGTERGTEVKCGPCAIVTRRASCLYSLDRTGLTQKSVFQCRTEAKHTYLFTKVACIACFRVFLESVEVKVTCIFNELQQNALQSVVDDRGILSSVFYASAKGWSSMSAVNKCSSNLFIEAH